MKNNLFLAGSYLKNLVQRNKFFLSYPKSGRTWIANIYLNYWYKATKNISEPLPFITRSADDHFVEFQKESRIHFTHGGKLKNLKSGEIAINPLILRNINTTLLIRDPMSLLISYYHHIHHQTLPDIKPSLSEFMMSDSGYKSLAHFHNVVLPELSKNTQSTIVTYESLHSSAINRMQAMEQMMHHSFGDLDQSSLLWAVEACDFNALKSRSKTGTKRIRKGEVSSVDEEIDPATALKIKHLFMDALVGDARKYYELHYPLSA